MFAVTYYLPTGAITTLLRGLALATIVVFVMFFVLAWAPVVCAFCWAGCCSLAATVAGVAYNLCVIAGAFGVALASVKLM